MRLWQVQAKPHRHGPRLESAQPSRARHAYADAHPPSRPLPPSHTAHTPTAYPHAQLSHTRTRTCTHTCTSRSSLHTHTHTHAQLSHKRTSTCISRSSLHTHAHAHAPVAPGHRRICRTGGPCRPARRTPP